MAKSNGRRGNLYEQVLDHTRREIDEASSKIDELRQTLRLLESRVEAAKSVYAAVATRLNLEDELEEETEFQEAPYPEEPEPPEEAEAENTPEASKPAASEPEGVFPGLSEEERRLIKEHLRRRTEAEQEG